MKGLACVGGFWTLVVGVEGGSGVDVETGGRVSGKSKTTLVVACPKATGVGSSIKSGAADCGLSSGPASPQLNKTNKIGKRDKLFCFCLVFLSKLFITFLSTFIIFRQYYLHNFIWVKIIIRCSDQPMLCAHQLGRPKFLGFQLKANCVPSDDQER